MQPGKTTADKKVDGLFSLMEEFGRSLFRELHLELQHLPRKATAQQMYICIALSRCGGRATVTDLAREIGVSLSAITAAANRMNEIGLVRRIRDESDHRVVWLELTPAGQEAVGAFLEVRDRVQRRYFDLLSEQDRSDLYRIMSKIKAATEQAPCDGA